MLASIYSCLTPSPGHAKIFAGNKIAVNNVIPSKADHTNTLELTYQGKEKEILDYCTNLSQYPFKYDEVT
ncbi:MAG: hypothetical protein LBG59_00565 [Candidatus Peribacteria bacterium]|jgi:hypothetical protein|nr:hypothetical protein [Candidatus Peribacteria bacterium]